ncbi:hypothetical protein BH18ACT17_BH18ACT17_01130 [soil metagenome]
MHGTAGSVNLDDKTTRTTSPATTGRPGLVTGGLEEPVVDGGVADLQAQLEDLDVR